MVPLTAVRAVNGTIFYNNDDEILENTLPEGSETYSFGTKHGHVTGELEGLTPFVKMNWSRNDYSSPTFETNMVGKYNFTNYLASAAIGAFFEVPQEQVTEALSKYTPSNNRSQVIRTDRNTLIMDCYNANPTSMRLALESFAMMEHDNKLAIMGDMKELGNESDPEHKNMLMLCEELDIRNITVGEEFGKQVSELRQAHFNTTDDLLEYLSSDPLDNHLLLLKGSRSIGLEKLENSL